MATPKVYVICDANCKFEGMTKEQILTAITQAVNESSIGDVDSGFITTVKTINGLPLRFFVGEQAAYDALSAEQKENLFAIITNDTTKAYIMEALDTLREDMESINETFDRITQVIVPDLQNWIRTMKNVKLYDFSSKLPRSGTYHIRVYFPTGNYYQNYGYVRWTEGEWVYTAGTDTILEIEASGYVGITRNGAPLTGYTLDVVKVGDI